MKPFVIHFTDVARESLHVASRLAEAFGAHLNFLQLRRDPNAGLSPRLEHVDDGD